jgi:molybdopterin-guanine dinucleotide biosynthesis protein B
LETAVVAVVGSKSSGKTTTIEALTKELTRRGYRVAAVKHIPEKDFTIDAENKDTWRFAQSGAKTVVSVAPNEIATIQKTHTNTLSLEEILAKCQRNDVVLIEGFRSLVGEDERVPKIVTVKSAEEATQASKTFKPIIAFTGPYSTIELALNAPYINVWKESAKIADIVERIIRKRNV